MDCALLGRIGPIYVGFLRLSSQKPDKTEEIDYIENKSFKNQLNVA